MKKLVQTIGDEKEESGVRRAADQLSRTPYMCKLKTI